MKQTLSDTLLEEVSRHVSEHMGLHFPRSRWRNLDRAFCSAARELGFNRPEECAEWFITAPLSRELIESLAGYMTVGETYFLRECHGFEILEQELIPELARVRRGGEKRLRIWSAGCATGEEPYTIAILLHRKMALLKDWAITILATDIAPHALRRAMEGVYTEWSFRCAPSWFREEYFRKTEEGRFELIPEIRKMVTFSSLNLVKDPYPSLLSNTNAMDAIFCRNVLMYLTPAWAKKVLERFHLCLTDGGWLFVSPCEASILQSSRFGVINFPDAIIYRKEKEEAPPAPRKQPEPVIPAPPPIPLATKTEAPEPPAAPSSPPPLRSVRVEAPNPYEEALSLYERGCYPEAAEKVAAALSRRRDDPRAISLLCRISANQGKLGKALELCEEAIAADRLNAGLHYLRAVILQERGEIDEAAASLKRALYLVPDLVLAHFALGNLARRQGKAGESRRHYENTLALLDRYHPDDILPESEGMSSGRLTEIIRSHVNCARNHERSEAREEYRDSTASYPDRFDERDRGSKGPADAGRFSPSALRHFAPGGRDR